MRGSVEEILNELLEAEAQKLTQAARYEGNEQRPLQLQLFYSVHSQGQSQILCKLRMGWK